MITSYRKIYIDTGIESNNGYLITADGRYIVLEDYNSSYVPSYEIEQVLRYPIAERFFKLYLLHEDETIKQDVTPYVLQEGNLEKTYQQGQTRSLSVSFINSSNIWNPSPANGFLFANSKFKLQMGVKVGNNLYWTDEGVFVCQDPNLKNSDANKVVNIELFDKFALLDGTITGTTETDYEIPMGTNIYKAVRSILRLSKDRLGHPYDSKMVIFPDKYKQEVLPYTIKKTANNTLGEIIIDLANCLSCDVFYDEVGRLTFRDNLDDLDYHNRNISWVFKKENETINVNRKDEWSKIKNRYIVIGSNINGFQCKGIAENTNVASPYNVNGYFGIRPQIIEDNLIYSNNYCRQRANYELKKNYMRNVSISFDCLYVPHIAPNDIVRWSFEDYNYVDENFIVDSVSIPLNPKEKMSMNITNISDLPL